MADLTPQELDNRITQAQSTADDAKNDINTHRYNLDIHTTLEWKNSVVLKETLGLYWTSAQVADKFADIQQQIDAIIAGGGGGSGGGSINLSNYYTKAEIDNSFSQLESQYIKVNDTTIVKLVNENEINLQEDHYNAWFGYRSGKVTNWKFGDGTEGGLADVYVKDLYLNDQKLSDLLGDYVKNTDYATSNKGGVIKFSTSHGVSMSTDGFLMGATRTAEQYNSNSGNMLINKGTLENVLTSKSETWEFTLSDGSTVTKRIVCL